MWFAEIIKALAWPATVVFIAMGYKPELLAFAPQALRRKLKIELPGGVKFEVDAAEQQQKAADIVKVKIDTDTIELKEIPGLIRTEAIASLERDLHARLKTITADPVDVLIRNLAQARLEAAFGFIYAGIFGSQIAGLVELGARRRVANSEAYNFYLEFEKKFPELYVDYGFSGWLNFMKRHGLIVQESSDVVITNFGDDFLKWLEATRLSKNKPW